MRWPAFLAFVVVVWAVSARAADVVLYTSVDQPYAAPIVRTFEKQTGLSVALVTDAEATKSVGLAERVRAEHADPQCDVFWSNEPFHTINLAAEGLLQPYESPSAGDVPAKFKDPDKKWASNALRARVIAVRGKKDEPLGVAGLSLQDLLKPDAKGKVAIARPSAGTTGGHVASLFVLWGDEKATDYFRKLRENGVKMLGGNGPVAESVGRGTIAIGLTDNDDVHSARREGGELAAGLPDQDQGGGGTLMVPTTVALVTGAKHPDAAKKLIDYLLSRDVERKLIEQNFAGWSVRDLEKAKVKAMDVDLREVARAMPTAVRKTIAILEGRE